MSVLCEEFGESAPVLATLAAKLSGLALDQAGSVDLNLEQLALQILGQVSPPPSPPHTSSLPSYSCPTMSCSPTAP